MLMTGFADQRERAHGLEALIYDVVPKPFSLQVLLDKVDDALARRRSSCPPSASWRAEGFPHRSTQPP